VKILHLSSYLTGGAGISASRLHDAISKHCDDCESHLATSHSSHYSSYPFLYSLLKNSQLSPSQVRSKLISLLLSPFLTARYPFQSYIGLFSSSIVSNSIHTLNPDVVHYHWIASEFVSIASIAYRNKPSVFTLHDSWFLNGCVPYKEDQFPDSLRSISPKLNLLHQILEKYTLSRKQRSYLCFPLHLIAPSSWIANLAIRACPYAHISIIPNAIPTDIFFPIPKQQARHSLGLDSNKFILLFSGNTNQLDVNKNLQFLITLVSRLAERHDILLVIKSKSGLKHPTYLNPYILSLPFENDSKLLARVYSAVNLTVVPSYIESFSLVAAESISCGTPVLAFSGTGLDDVISNGHTGLLVDENSPDAVFNLIESHILQKSFFKPDVLHNLAVREWSPDVVSTSHHRLYQAIVE